MIWRMPQLMGIVNATPDSFSDGGEYRAPERAVARAVRLLDDGADLIDVGGESTRPGAAEVPVDEEIARVVPVVAGLKRLRPDCPVSVDTRKAAVAAAALAAGATIVNDVSGLAFEPELAAVAARAGARLILGHTRGNPDRMRAPENCRYTDVVAEVAAALEAAAAAAAAAGVPRAALIFDPCLGFAKTAEQDWELLRRLPELTRLGPVLIGHSRKSFLGRLLDEPEPKRREAATAAVSLWAARQGAAMLRVHEVRPTRDTLRVWRMLENAGENDGRIPQNDGNAPSNMEGTAAQ